MNAKVVRCPKRRREKEEIFLRDSLDLSNQGRWEIDGAMSLYQVAKWVGRPSQYLSHILSTLFFSIGQKSDQGIVLDGGQHKAAVDLAMESAVSLPEIPVWPGTQRNLTVMGLREFLNKIIGSARENSALWDGRGGGGGGGGKEL